MTYRCKICKEPIHPRRVELGYTDSCVNHSTAAKFSGLVVADGKSTSWLNIIRDEETAKHIQTLVETRGR